MTIRTPDEAHESKNLCTLADDYILGVHKKNEYKRFW